MFRASAQVADVLTRDPEGDAGVSQRLGERAEIAVDLAQRPTGARGGSDVLPVGVIKGDFGCRPYVNGRTARPRTTMRCGRARARPDRHAAYVVWRSYPGKPGKRS
jgi:hypothetical protein